ncbi:MAG: ABC transporter permease [Bacteroidetes bacterium]|nr:MAG: ABC transporter permease [Bacteroidota bacterium]
MPETVSPSLLLREVLALLYKELSLEWKQQYALNGLLLYVFSMVTVIALAAGADLPPLTWNLLYWVLVVFAAINAVAKSFIAEKGGHLLYLYTLARPAAIILAKLIYNSLLLFTVAALTLGTFVLLTGTGLPRPGLMIGLVALGSAALSATLTLLSAIAAKAENRTTLLAVLSFPLLVPTLLVLIRLSRIAVEGLDVPVDSDSLMLLSGIVVILTGVTVVLFPFVWRD